MAPRLKDDIRAPIPSTKARLAPNGKTSERA